MATETRTYTATGRVSLVSAVRTAAFTLAVRS